MDLYQSLGFRPFGDPQRRLMLVLRTHDLSGTDYDPLFSVSAEDARGIVAGCDAIRFIFGDPEPLAAGNQAEPIELAAHHDGRDEKCPWVLVAANQGGREIARMSGRSLALLQEAGALSEDLVSEPAKFFIACDRAVEVLCEEEAHPNRRPLDGSAASDIKAAIEVLRKSNEGLLKGPYHLEDAAGERIHCGIPGHDARNWPCTDYTGQCRSCGHAFLGPKRAPACKPCYDLMERQAAESPMPKVNGELTGQPGLAAAAADFQHRVQPWLLECFGEQISKDRQERNHRFLEEALELVQANGCTRSEAMQLVDYVFDRPVGELHQEAGGVMVTLAALCLAADLDMHAEAERELARVWTKVDKIRAKQAAKPKFTGAPAQPGRLEQLCVSPGDLRRMIEGDPECADGVIAGAPGNQPGQTSGAPSAEGENGK